MGKSCRLWVLVGCVATLACTTLLRRDRRQCETNADCEQLGLTFRICNSEGMCQAYRVARAECSTNRDCANAVKTGIGRCLAGECVPLSTTDCTTTLGDSSRTDATYLGLLAPLTGDEFTKELGKKIEKAVDTAVRTYNQGVSGQQGDPRPLIVVVCDETPDVQTATEHLVNTVGVKGILGPFDEARLDSIVEITKPANVVVMSPFADGPDFDARHGGSGLVWSCAANRSGALLYLRNLVSFFVAKIQSRDSKFTPVVALYTSDDSAATQMADKAVELGVFPGTPTRVTYPYFLLAKTTPNYANLAAPALENPRANLIVNLGSGFGYFGKILIELEKESDETNRPYYLSYQRSRELAVAIAGTITDSGGDAGPNLNAYQRTLVFDQPQSKSVNDAEDIFISKYQAISRSLPDEQLGLAYDCVYALALGLQAARDGSSAPPESVTGEQVKAGMARFLSGESWGIAVDIPSKVFTSLSVGGSVDVYGASGDLPFNVEKGYPDPGGGLWCLQLDLSPNYPRAVYKSTGATFSPISGKQEGEFACAPTW